MPLYCVGADIMILPSRILLRRISPSWRSSSIFPLSPLRSSIQQLRWSSNALPDAPKSNRKFIFPERLLVYHAGTGRAVFLGCLKVTTIFIFSFFCLVVAPTHFYAEDQQPWVTAAVMLSGVVPLVFVSYVSSPFVANIHLRLPPFARYSSNILQRYSQNLPKDAKLDITTISLIGKPRTTAIRIGELQRARERFGMVNYIRETKVINSKRPWWMGKAVRQFGVHGGVAMKDPNSGIWENIARSIAKR